MRILITGGAGFIGSNLAALLQDKADITILDNLRTGSLDNLRGLKYRFIGGSINNKSAIKAAMKDIDYVFHLAALTSVQESITNIEECVEINSYGILNVLECARYNKVKKVIFASSAAVYGDDLTIETCTAKPKSPYAITKLKGELYTTLNNANNTSFRFFNVFGPKQSVNSDYASVIPIFISKALRGEDIVIYGDGQQTRDFIFVKDIVNALYYATYTDMPGIYNIGYGSSITINELANSIIRLTGSNSRIIHAPTKSGEVLHSRSNNAKLYYTGFTFTSSFDEGLKETIKEIKTKLS